MQTDHNQAVIWDMDGVLIDSGDLHYLAWRDTLAAEQGIALSREQFDRTFGKDNFTTLALILGQPPTPEQLTRIAGRKEVAYRAAAAEQVRPVPGALALMKSLFEAGWRQAVGTSAPRANLELIIDLLGIDQWLAAGVCADDVARGKPDPAIFLLAAARLGVPPGRCVVLEDSPAGLAAAQAGGMHRVGLTTTHPAAELGAAERIVPSPAAVTPAMLAELVAGSSAGQQPDSQRRQRPHQ